MRKERERKVIWSPLSLHDVHDLGDHLAQVVSAAKAEMMIASILRAGDMLNVYPRLWRMRDDIHSGLRLALVKPYVVCYTAGEGNVRIVRVLHGAQDIAAALSESPMPYRL